MVTQEQLDELKGGVSYLTDMSKLVCTRHGSSAITPGC